jgi:hypothetical protein
VTAIGIGTVSEQPLKRFRFEILARSEENRKPAPTESVHVRAMAHQQLHHGYPAGLRHPHERNVLDQELAELGFRRQEMINAIELVGVDGSPELAGYLEGLDVLLEPGPAGEAVVLGDLKLPLGERRSGAGAHEFLGLVAEMAEVRTVG